MMLLKQRHQHRQQQGVAIVILPLSPLALDLRLSFSPLIYFHPPLSRHHYHHPLIHHPRAKSTARGRRCGLEGLSA